jgi:cysteine-rich repeat protein
MKHTSFVAHPLLALAALVGLFIGSTGCMTDFPLSLINSNGSPDAALPPDAGDAALPPDAGDAALPPDAGDGGTPVCGDRVVGTGETCDDGAQVVGDGCGATCLVEEGFTCAGEPSVCTPICGDGQLLGDETCDDGNTTGGDGCSEDCQVECANGSAVDCNPDGATLIPGSAFVDPAPPAGWVQCAGFSNTAGNDVTGDWDAGCLGEERVLRIRYFETSPLALVGDAILSPACTAAYVTQELDAANQGGTTGFLETAGVTLLKDDPDAGGVTTFTCNAGNPAKTYGATDLYLADQANAHFVMVCGHSLGDAADAPCRDQEEIFRTADGYEVCRNQRAGDSALAIALYHEP